jgi:ComF family protein
MLASVPLRAPFHSWLAGQCEVCRQWGRGALCTDCIARYAAPRPRCARCGLRLGTPAPVCGACLRDAPPHVHTVCAADYEHPWDALIAAFKFHDRPELAQALAQRLVAAVHSGGAPLPTLVLPVPLSPRRLAERGYNQAWELARRAASALQLAADATLLQRPVEQEAHQAELTRAERLRNLQGAFMVDPRRRPALQGQAVALVDDVMTTGATLHQAANALLRAGAASVQAWVLARTPDVR